MLIDDFIHDNNLVIEIENDITSDEFLTQIYNLPIDVVFEHYNSLTETLNENEFDFSKYDRKDVASYRLKLHNRLSQHADSNLMGFLIQAIVNAISDNNYGYIVALCQYLDRIALYTNLRSSVVIWNTILAIIKNVPKEDKFKYIVVTLDQISFYSKQVALDTIKYAKEHNKRLLNIYDIYWPEFVNIEEYLNGNGDLEYELTEEVHVIEGIWMSSFRGIRRSEEEPITEQS